MGKFWEKRFFTDQLIKELNNTSGNILFNIFLPLSSITAYTHACALCEAQWQRGFLSLPSDTLPFFTPGGSLRLSERDGDGCGSIEDTAGPSRLKCHDQSRDYGSKSLAEFWLWNKDDSCTNAHYDNTNITQYFVFQSLTKGLFAGAAHIQYTQITGRIWMESVACRDYSISISDILHSGY